MCVWRWVELAQGTRGGPRRQRLALRGTEDVGSLHFKAAADAELAQAHDGGKNTFKD